MFDYCLGDVGLSDLNDSVRDGGLFVLDLGLGDVGLSDLNDSVRDGGLFVLDLGLPSFLYLLNYRIPFLSLFWLLDNNFLILRFFYNLPLLLYNRFFDDGFLSHLFDDFTEYFHFIFHPLNVRVYEIYSTHCWRNCFLFDFLHNFLLAVSRSYGAALTFFIDGLLSY
jgi:hypothetical protein